MKVIRRKYPVVLAGGAAALVLLLSGCNWEQVQTGPTQNQSIAVALGSAERANVELDIAAGQLHLSGGNSDKLVSGSFEFNVPSYKPEIASSINGTHAVLTIKQPSQSGLGGHVINNWNLELNNKALLDLVLNCGAGQANLNLGSVALRSLEVHMGAGQVDLDLRGHPERDYEVNISGGVGQATIHLPQDVGIRADAHGGLGSISVTGLAKTGDHYQNELYDKAKVNIRLGVSGGIGEIRIIG